MPNHTKRHLHYKNMGYDDEISRHARKIGRPSGTGVAIFFGKAGWYNSVVFFYKEFGYGQGRPEEAADGLSCEVHLNKALAAVESAPDGQWIAASEWAVRAGLPIFLA